MLQLSTSALLLLAATAASPDRAVQVGSHRQLFVDRHLIVEMKGVALELHRPVPREAVLKMGKPWEGETSWAGGALADCSQGCRPLLAAVQVARPTPLPQVSEKR